MRFLIRWAFREAARTEYLKARRDPTTWLLTRGLALILLLTRGLALILLLAGWLFIAWQNRFHITAPVAFLCLGYLAVMATVINLWRTGAAAVSPDLGNSDAWARPLGERGELEKEKRTLLKAIKEAEFDHEMGKLSKADADAMIQTYRARAIAVIKELERLEDTSHAMDPSGRILDKKETVRDQITREVKARLELAGANKKAKKAVDKAATKTEKAAAKPATTKVETTDDKVATAEVETAANIATPADDPAPPVEASGTKSDSTEASS
jgi:hypothetical protein